jgi:polar amino acid transport system ATP-binding protein
MPPAPDPVAMSEVEPEAATTPAIAFEHVSKRWGDHEVLKGLNFTVNAGEKVTIIGPSGSGKTTILRILMTLETPSDGIVRVFDQVLWDARDGKAKETRQTREVRKQVGMVFQSFNLFPHMTAMENVVEAPIKVLKLSRDESRERAVGLLDMVGLKDHANKRPPQLSGGQQQRVAIARALAMRPKILLFDEPTSALDPELIGDVLDVIRDLAKSSDITMLLVTHEMRFAQEISDRVVMFDAGVTVESGPPSQIFTTPEHERTRKFLRAVLER